MFWVVSNYYVLKLSTKNNISILSYEYILTHPNILKTTIENMLNIKLKRLPEIKKRYYKNKEIIKTKALFKVALKRLSIESEFFEIENYIKKHFNIIW